MRGRRWVWAVAAVASMFVVGCGGSSGGGPSAASTGYKVSGNLALSPKELMTKASVAVAAASGVHIFGTTGTDAGDVVQFDVRVNRTSAVGVIHFKERVVQVRKVSSGKFYFQANDAYWKASVPPEQQASFLRAIRGKWVHVTAGDTQFATLLTFGSWDTFTSKFTRASGGGQYEQGPANVVRGIDTVSATDKASGAIIAFPEHGPTLPIEITNGGQVSDFDSWNKPVNVPAPPASQVIEAARLTN